ncbi:MAG: hypothetical protein ACI9SE_001604 [Neolewinella sp.]|jgi:hypothetical protein
MRMLPIAFLSMLPMLTWPASAQEAHGRDGKQDADATEGQDPVPGDGQTQVPSDFVRFVKVGDGGHLDTAVTTYEKDGVKVIFYGAVHIADRAIFQEMNKRFKTCDALLYELVGPEDYRPTKDREQSGFNPVSMLQQGMKQSMGLTFQLDEVDYQPENFVHADMTPDEFQSSMLERGESLMSIMFDMMANGMKMQQAQQDADEESSKPPEKFDLVKAFRSREGQHLMRVTFAAQLEQMEMLAAGGDGSTLLEGRNEKCLRVLRREIGKGKKRLGIYYGAAHLPHLEMRLVEDMGFKKVAHEWLVAWDCKKRPDPKKDMKLAKLIRKCKRDLGELAEVGVDYRSEHGSKAMPASVRELKRYGVENNRNYDGPLTDPWGSDFRIAKRKWGSRWMLISDGPDKTPGTDDDIKINEPSR